MARHSLSSFRKFGYFNINANTAGRRIDPPCLPGHFLKTISMFLLKKKFYTRSTWPAVFMLYALRFCGVIHAAICGIVERSEAVDKCC
jgi:hypothetical protein